MEKRKSDRHVPTARPMILDVLPAHMAARLDVVRVAWWKRGGRWVGGRHRRMLIFFGGSVTAGALVLFLFAQQTTALLPHNLTRRITGFAPYFYDRSIPAGYTLNKARIVYDGQVLMVPLEKPDGPTLVLTEQPFPPGLTDESIQQNGEGVTTSIGKATINNIEGRLVGTLIIRGHSTLILLNAPGDANKDDLRTLLHALRPIHPS